MLRLVSLGLAIAASLVLYLLVFGHVHRPLTMGQLRAQLEMRTRYVMTLPSPKLVVFAGSNGRYSHRCEPMARPLAWPCANMSLAVGIGLDFLLARLEPLLAPGDVVYMPLEFLQYAVSRDEMHGGAENAALVHDMREDLWRLPPARIARALGSFDLSHLIHGLGEMALARIGYQRRGSLASTTPQGDEMGHDADAAAPYAAYLRQTRHAPVAIPETSHAIDVLDGFLQRTAARGVLVIGGLPTIPEHVAISPSTLQRLEQLYERRGHRLLVLENRSQYGLECFFDSLGHLREECQLAHSAQVGIALARLVSGATR